MRIYVGNLSKNTTEHELRVLFARVGTVGSARLLGTGDAHLGRPFAFIEMPSDGEAENAIAQLDGTEVAGQPIRVSTARPRRERDVDTIRASIGATRPYHTRHSSSGPYSSFKSTVF